MIPNGNEKRPFERSFLASTMTGKEQRFLGESIFEDLLHHPALSRLKDVNLLGAIGYFLRTAGLSRYDHCVGCAELASAFLNDYDVPDEDRMALLLAALLHDVGHPPFSHSTELSLYEMFNRYHRGQTSLMLRNHTLHFHTKTSIQEIISRNESGGPAVFRKVLRILGAMSHTRSMKEHVYHIMTSPINIDTLDAITRTASALGLPTVDPGEIIESLHYIPGEGIFVNRKAFSLLEDFWRLKNTIYQYYIFDLENQAMEAMVNRAVSLVCERQGQTTPFYLLTDQRLIDEFALDQRSRFLWELIHEGRAYVPIWGDLVSVDNKQSRMSFLAATKGRELIERWFAERLGVAADEQFKVIFHVTTYKRFVQNSCGRLPMFDMPLCRLSEIFKVERMVVFNVFVAPEILSRQGEEECASLIQQFDKDICEAKDGNGGFTACGVTMPTDGCLGQPLIRTV